MRRFLIVSGVFAGVGCLLLGLAAWRVHVWSSTAIEPDSSVVVVIPAGSSFRQVAARLGAAGVVEQPFLMRIWARVSGADRRVRSGEFLFEGPLTPLQVLAKLRGSESFARRVTLPEGLTAEQIRGVLEEAGLGGRDVYECVMSDPILLASFALPATGVEGYLFPDTYDFEPGTDPVQVVRRMLERFREVSAGLAAERAASGMSEVEMVILASVIEKETGSAGERARIAGVFHNRMRLGMKLQSDPTVVYGRDGDWGRPIRRSDLANPHPYNTYAHAGLPPGPIANPGRAALRAAVSPAVTKDLYFVSRNDGSHEFSRSLRQHNNAVRKYQR